MTKRKTYRILLDRLEEFGVCPTDRDNEPWWINYDHKISVYGLLSRTTKENPLVHCNAELYSDEYWTANDHARRIIYLINHPKELMDPIHMTSIDYCVASDDPLPLYHMPLIDDGWHRLYGHFYLGKKYINATWKGSRNLLNYLTGN